ncbi:MAG: GNAT family N-acetyltransferase, partial [Pseudomonadota bacterium]
MRAFGLWRGDAAIGLFLLKRPPAAPEWAGPKSVTLHALKIDAAAQGGGLGRLALAAAIREARRFAPKAEAL